MQLGASRGCGWADGGCIGGTRLCVEAARGCMRPHGVTREGMDAWAYRRIAVAMGYLCGALSAMQS